MALERHITYYLPQGIARGEQKALQPKLKQVLEVVYSERWKTESTEATITELFTRENYVVASNQTHHTHWHVFILLNLFILVYTVEARLKC